MTWLTFLQWLGRILIGICAFDAALVLVLWWSGRRKARITDREVWRNAMSTWGRSDRVLVARRPEWRN